MPANPFKRVDQAASDAIAAMGEVGAEHVCSAMQAADGWVVGAMVITRDPGRAKDLLAMEATWEAADEKPDAETADDAPAAPRHTPGPWTTRRGGDGLGWRVYAPDQSHPVAVVGPEQASAPAQAGIVARATVQRDGSESANAYLIAVGPELLAACEAAYADLVQEECEASALGLRLAAVIAKARRS